MQPRDHNSNGVLREASLRTALLHMTTRKWRFVRAFEAVARLLRPLIPSRPAPNAAEPPATILVVEYWNLGDLAILAPFLTNLRRAFPKARISLLVKAGLESVFEGQGIADEFIPVRVPWAQHFRRWRKYNPFSFDWVSFARTIRGLHKRRFDWAFSGRMDVRDNFFLWLTGARRRIGYGFAGGGTFLTDRVLPDLTRPHRSETWLQLLEAVGASPSRPEIRLQLEDAALSFARSYLGSLGVPPNAFLVGVHPGARIPTRRWGADRYAQVARRLLKQTDAHILWFSEPGAPSRGPSLERCHPVSLDFRPFVALLSRCRLLVCNDSGPMHLANLLNLPVVAVFGPQKPEWFGPRGLHDRVVIRPEFSCRPCFDYCVFDEPYCLRSISVDEVYDAVMKQVTCILSPERVRVSSKDAVELASHA